MKRCVIRFNGDGGYANIAAERLEPYAAAPETLIAVIDEAGEIVGIFDLACVMSIYLKEGKGSIYLSEVNCYEKV